MNTTPPKTSDNEMWYIIENNSPKIIAQKINDFRECFLKGLTITIKKNTKINKTILKFNVKTKALIIGWIKNSNSINTSIDNKTPMDKNE